MNTVDNELAATGREIGETADRRRLPPWQPPSRRIAARVATAAVAAVMLIAAIAIPAFLLRGSDTADNASEPPPPDDFGTWAEIAQAPIPSRPHAVSVWSGTEAVFWAGSNLDRDFAFGDGAAYDPLTDTWRSIPVPGWGHPGLTGVFFGGELYALAKGGGTRFDPTDGIWADLPQVEGMWLAAAVATDQAVWGLGPAAVNPEGQSDVAIARFDPEGSQWIYGPVFEGTPETGSLLLDQLALDQPVLWTGSEIVLWHPDGGGLTFNPATEVWRQLPAPSPPAGVISVSRATVADSELVAIAEVVTDGTSKISLARYHDESWTWHDLDIVVDDFATVTVASASDWLLVFTPNQAPITVHVPSGAWTQHTDGPLGGIQSPNVVWTGNALVVWGGVNSPTESNPTPPDGAIWTPPDR